MLEKFLRKQTIFLLLAVVIILPTIAAVVFHFNFHWWLQKSSFFAVTVIVGIYIGQLSTVYKIKHLVETGVDELVNKLAIPKIAKLDDPNLETESFVEFSNALLELLCEDFGYHGGIIHIFNGSLKPTFKHTFISGSKLSLPLTIDDYELMHEVCAQSPSGPITMYINAPRGNVVIDYSKRSDTKRKRSLAKDSVFLKFSYARLLPIYLENSYLGYLGLLRKDRPSIFEKLLDLVQLLSEKSILTAIENRKIDDAIKNFLSRQTLLQVFLTLTLLDRICENYETIESTKKLGDLIVDVLRDCWKFNACLILTSDDHLSAHCDENVDLNLIKNKLIPRIKLRFGSDSSLSSLLGSAADIYDFDEKPGFQEFIAIKIQKGSKSFGYLIATSKRQLTNFEKQLLVILENYKIDDTYEFLTAR